MGSRRRWTVYQQHYQLQEEDEDAKEEEEETTATTTRNSSLIHASIIAFRQRSHKQGGRASENEVGRRCRSLA